MKNTGLLCSLRALAIVTAFITGSGAVPALAGETAVYLKSGWFNWVEKVNGGTFVQERGFLHAAGIARKDALSAFTIGELLEVWGGSLDYDGHDVTGAVPLKADTSYLGTREEVAFGVKLPVQETLSVEPFLGAGHKFWIRTRSSEDWNTFYTKAGVSGEFKANGCTIYVKGGAMVPLYTRTHASLSDAGYTDVVTEPKSQVSGFAEAKVKFGVFAVSFEYEAMEFGQSDSVPTSKTSGAGQGVTVVGSQAYQPKSSSSLYSLKLSYSF
jgi:hypothetical protein